MWELDCEESWALKNWCFWTVVLEKTLESPLAWKEIQPVHPKGDQSWVFVGRTDAEAETPILWPPHVKSWLVGKVPDAGRDWGQEEKGTTEDEMAGWHHWLKGHKSEQTLGVCDGQGGLVCYDSRGRKESDTTEWLNWIELNWGGDVKCFLLFERLKPGGRDAKFTHSQTHAGEKCRVICLLKNAEFCFKTNLRLYLYSGCFLNFVASPSPHFRLGYHPLCVFCLHLFANKPLLYCVEKACVCLVLCSCSLRIQAKSYSFSHLEYLSLSLIYVMYSMFIEPEQENEL